MPHCSAPVLLAALAGDASASPQDLKTYEALKLKAGKDSPGPGQAGALVRGARAGCRAAQAPGPGGAGRPRERDGARAAGPDPLRRPLGVAREDRRAGQGRRAARGPAGRVQRAAGQAGREGAGPPGGRRAPQGEGPARAAYAARLKGESRAGAGARQPRHVVRAERPEARGDRPLHDGRAPRPVARVVLAAPGLREAERPVDQPRAGRRRGEGRARAAPGQSPLGAAPAEMEGLAGRCSSSPSRGGRGATGDRDRPPRRPRRSSRSSRSAGRRPISPGSSRLLGPDRRPAVVAGPGRAGRERPRSASVRTAAIEVLKKRPRRDYAGDAGRADPREDRISGPARGRAGLDGGAGPRHAARPDGPDLRHAAGLPAGRSRSAAMSATTPTACR